MSQCVTQNVAADIVVVLTDAVNAPVLGLTDADIVVEYRKEGAAAFVAKSITPTSGAVTSGNAETYTLVDGQTLDVAVDGGVPQTATFNLADFVDINNATAAEIAAVITTDIVGATAADVGGFVVITSDTAGDTSSIQVTGGTANVALGFPTSLNSGQTFLVEIGDGVYTILFFASELDTVGSFTVKVTGATITQHVAIASVLAAGTTPTVAAVQTCVINGHVFDPSGRPLQGAGVGARIIGFPSIEQNSIGLTTNEVTAVTDANGEFFLTLVRLAEVEVTIPVMNYRRQITVPNLASANLFTGIP